MKTYQSHKTVQAVQLKDINSAVKLNQCDGGNPDHCLISDVNGIGHEISNYLLDSAIGISNDFYLVKHNDCTWLEAKDLFERNHDEYTDPNIEDLPKSDEFNFGHAIHYMKRGQKVARKGWNGKDMYIYHVPAASYPASNNSNNTMLGVFPDDMVPYGEYTAMKTAQGNVIPWLCSQSDQWANDWTIVN